MSGGNGKGAGQQKKKIKEGNNALRTITY